MHAVKRRHPLEHGSPLSDATGSNPRFYLSQFPFSNEIHHFADTCNCVRLYFSNNPPPPSAFQCLHVPPAPEPSDGAGGRVAIVLAARSLWRLACKRQLFGKCAFFIFALAIVSKGSKHILQPSKSTRGTPRRRVWFRWAPGADVAIAGTFRNYSKLRNNTQKWFVHSCDL